MTRTVNKPFAYYGGKDKLAPLLASLLPPHQCYVEVFGGSGALLFRKAPSPLEIYNDLDGGLVHFFRTLRNPQRAKRLKEALDLTPYAREEWQECKAGWRQTSDEIEMARQWYTAICQSFSKDQRATMTGTRGGWSFSREAEANPARKFRTAISCLPQFTRRLAEVQIEQADFRQLIPRYDGPETLFYCDPPYLMDSRRAPDKGYAHEMSSQDHYELLELLQRIDGMAVISGYPSQLYDAMLVGWECISRRVTCDAAGRTNATGLKGKGSIKASQGRAECIWLNPAAQRQQHQLSLFAETETAEVSYG